MSTEPAVERPRLPPIDPATMRRLLLHEARVHATPDRDLRDLGDAILLHDPVEPEPFWNRLEGIRWPSAPAEFDRRLTEALILFATLGRQPHIWASPLHDSPPDLVARLRSNGFADMGPGDVMALADPRPARRTAGLPLPREVTIERQERLAGARADAAARRIVSVLVNAFDVEAERHDAVLAETVASLAHPAFTHYLVSLDGTPAAVARRATFEGASYLSSIGTAGWARHRGLGRLVTATAATDALTAGSEWTYLGVFADNTEAIRLYEQIGFERVGESSPDLLLVR
jgi:ribosomal protein S18 acetylase RimI-like enzyme